MRIALIDRGLRKHGPHTGSTTYASVLAGAAVAQGASIKVLPDIPITGAYDVVHVLDMKQFAVFPAPNVARRCPFPLVMDMHDDYWTGRASYPAIDAWLRRVRRNTMRPRYLDLLRRASRVIVHSPTVTTSVPHDRVHCIPLPSAPARLRVKTAELNTLHVLFAGRDSLRKGLAVLADGLRLMKQHGQPFQLHVVGADFPHLRMMRRLWLRGIPAVFHGELSQEAMEDLWDRVHVAVLPSHEETFGLVPLEALLRGIPVVVTDVGGLGPWVRACDGGGVVPPGDPQALALALEAVATQYTFWKGKAVEAMEKLKETHDAGSVWIQTEKVYRSVK